MARDTLNHLVELLESHRKDHVQHFLREHGLASTGTWDTIEDRVRGSVRRGRISLDELIRLLDTIEEHGNQHIFIYRAERGYLSELRRDDPLHVRVRSAGAEHLWNRSDVEALPESPTLVGVRKTSDLLKLKWVEKRVWIEPLEERQEERDGRIVLVREFEQKEARGVTVFQIDLTSGVTQVKIQRFKPKDRTNDYQAKLDFYWGQASQFVDRARFAQVDISRAIKSLADNTEVRRRGYRFMSPRGNTFDTKSGHKNVDIAEDPAYADSIQKIKQTLDGRYAYVYWLPSGTLSEELPTKIYAQTREIAILRECREEETEYVLSRIIELS